MIASTLVISKVATRSLEDLIARANFISSLNPGLSIDSRYEPCLTLKFADETEYEFSESDVRSELCKRRFMETHELTRDELDTDHWQTLFAIEYPEAR